MKDKSRDFKKSIFAFGNDIVTVIQDLKTGEFWFLAQDVARVLEYTSSKGGYSVSHLTRNLLEDEYAYAEELGIRGSELFESKQNYKLITEAGFYRTMFRSKRKKLKRVYKLGNKKCVTIYS